MLPVTEIVLPQLASNVPAFLAKLWKMVDDPETDHLIAWGDLGNSFVIHNQAEFSQSLLPYYYKHSNMASFVRQLNMYGFHKVVGVDAGGLKSEKDQEMEFAHPFFLRGQDILLTNIKRKVASSKANSSQVATTGNAYVPSANIKTEKVTEVLNEVTQLKDKQEDMDSKLETMKKENEALWREVINLRQKHSNQQKIVNKLIHFLMGCLQGGIHPGHAVKRRYQQPLAIESTRNPKQPRFEPTLNPTEVQNQSMENSGAGPIIFDVTENQLNSPEKVSSPKVEVPLSPLSAAMTAVDPTLVNPAISVTGRPTLQREISKEDFDSETFLMQKEIDNLKDILSGQITLDSSLISNLFNPNEPPLYQMNQPSNQKLPLEMETPAILNHNTEQPSLFELADISEELMPAPDLPGDNNEANEGNNFNASLETPLITVETLDTNPLLAQITKKGKKKMF